MKSILTLCLITSLFSCKKEAIPAPTSQHSTISEDYQKVELVWLKNSSIALFCRGTFIYGNGVVYVISENRADARDKIISLDKNTGDTLWVWNEVPIFTNNWVLRNDILYFNANTSIFAVDCNSGTTVWESKANFNEDHLSLSVNDFGVFVSYQIRNPSDQTLNTTTLYKLDKFGRRKEVYRINATDRDGFTFNFQNITPWVHSNGDTILIAESRSWNYSPRNEGKGEYLALNISADSVYADWSNVFNDMDIGGKCVVYENHVYFSSGWNQLASFNLTDKKRVWKKELPGHLFTSSNIPLVILNQKLFIGIGNKGVLNIYDIRDGNVIKSIKGIGTDWFTTSFVEFKDNLYFITSKGLYGLNSNGQFVIEVKTEDAVGRSKGSFTMGMGIDQNTGKIYTTRGNDFVCIQIK